MKFKRKSVIVINFAVTLVLFSCTKSNEGTFTERIESKIQKNFIEIEWLMWPSEHPSWFMQVLEEKFNVKIIPVSMDSNTYNSYSLIPSKEEFPDCGFIFKDPYLMYEQGTIREIPEEMIHQNMPGYTKIAESNPLWWKSMVPLEAENAYLCLTSDDLTDDASPYCLSTKVDWADRVGVNFPNYGQKKYRLSDIQPIYWLDEDITLDWWEKLLIKYRDGDPDGNGQIDTIPWPGEQDVSWMWIGIAGCFGVEEGPVIQDGKLTMGEITNSFKELCRLAQRWYRSGLIDKDFNRLRVYNILLRASYNRIGALPYMWGFIDREDQTPDPFQYDETVLVPPVVGPNGQRGWYKYPGLGRYSTRFFVNSSVHDEKLERILQIIEYTSFDEVENYVYARWGKPNIHFDWEGQPWQSRAITREKDQIPSEYPEVGGFIWTLKWSVAWHNPDWLMFNLSKPLHDFLRNYLLSERIQKKMTVPYEYDLLLDRKLVEIARKYEAAANNVRQKFLRDVMWFRIDLDAKWDDYVKEWRESGGDELIYAYEKYISGSE